MAEPEEIESEEIPQENTLEISNPILPLLEMAINKDLDVEKLERLMQMKKDWDAEQARIAFNEAMMEFQSLCPIIIKSVEGANTRLGERAYKFAPMDVILRTKCEDGRTVKKLIADCGFSYMTKIENLSEGKIKGICIIKHKLGHTDESSVEVPYLKQTGVMSDAQVVAGTGTFALRYAFNHGFGILTGDEDNDGADKQALDNMVNDLIKDFKYKDEIVKVIATIESSKTLRSFISKMPTTTDTAHFIELVSYLNDDQQDNYWKIYETAVIKVKWALVIEKLEFEVKAIKASSNNSQNSSIEAQG